MPTGATARYFTRVYPLLRGAGAPTPAAAVGRRVTEPGQSARLKWVLRELAPCAPQRILDAGCGTGLYTTALARRGHAVTALDLSPRMLAATRERAETEGLGGRIECVQADLWSWEPSEPYDTVLCMGVLEYYLRADQLLRRLYSWTRGRLLLSVTGYRWDVRSAVRAIWLASQGVQARGYRTSELACMMARLPEAENSVVEMRWAHCARALRLLTARPVAPEPAVRHQHVDADADARPSQRSARARSPTASRSPTALGT